MSNHAAHLAMLEALTPRERKLFFAESKLASEVHWLDWLADEVRDIGMRIELYQSKLRGAALDYQAHPSEDTLNLMELLAELIEGEKEQRKRTMAELKPQRERVRWQREWVKTMKAQQSS